MINDLVRGFQDISAKDLPTVGGKNASLGEMIQHLQKSGVSVPQGFATTAKAFQEFLEENQLKKKIHDALQKLDVHDVKKLAEVGQNIRQWILASKLSQSLENEITKAYQGLEKQLGHDFSVAVRSSATAEDLPDASFAGLQETFLNVKGIDNVLHAVKEIYASLYNDRAINYRVHHGFLHHEVSISVGIQQMVRSDCGVSGVMFTLDTESGFDQVVLINATYGLGELLVQGAVDPDEFYVYKPALQGGFQATIRKNLGSKLKKMIYSDAKKSDAQNERVKVVPVPEDQQKQFCLIEKELEILAKQALLIEKHYGRPMDIEWAKDGITGQLYILQARPETVMNRVNHMVLERYHLETRGKVLVEGRAVGQKIGQGIARIIQSPKDMHRLKAGEVLVTDMTDPDWEPVMKRASAIITNRGGRTCHAAIIARELGVPAIVGTHDATQKIREGQEVTVSCAEGDTGYVYEGILSVEHKRFDLDSLPDLPFKIMMTVGNPERAFDFQKLPNSGVGLARIEFIINQMIGVHPRACLEWKSLETQTQNQVLARASGYGSPIDFYVDKLREGIATLASAFWPKPVIVRLSDFKSNEYANLLGGDIFEPKEENPMIGFRGASRYVSDSFRDSFALECHAIRKVREDNGLTNVEVMVPFVRTPIEAEQVINLLAEHGLKRGVHGLRLIMMCEIPANALLADEFLAFFDGFSIGSNDLTQLTLGLDRDSGLVAHHFDERNSAVQLLLQKAIESCKRLQKTIGICGQGPSDHIDFAHWLMEKGVDSLSLNPDSVLRTWIQLAEKNKKE